MAERMDAATERAARPVSSCGRTRRDTATVMSRPPLQPGSGTLASWTPWLVSFQS